MAPWLPRTGKEKGWRIGEEGGWGSGWKQKVTIMVSQVRPREHPRQAGDSLSLCPLTLWGLTEKLPQGCRWRHCMDHSVWVLPPRLLQPKLSWVITPASTRPGGTQKQVDQVRVLLPGKAA